MGLRGTEDKKHEGAAKLGSCPCDGELLSQMLRQPITAGPEFANQFSWISLATPPPLSFPGPRVQRGLGRGPHQREEWNPAGTRALQCPPGEGEQLCSSLLDL